ncbi:MAG TPA: sulfite exporter TauE/SafE family protein [Ferruginibacter sp.]|nr:sulfite exporter TauE/SafE family protein [Ferruginibacter sp.]
MEVLGYIASVLIGISLGLIGSGGSILTVPVMVYLFAVSPQLATSYSLFVVGCTSLAGVFTRAGKNGIDFKTAALFGSTSIITVFVTRKFIMPRVPQVLFSIGDSIITLNLATMLLFAILMLLASYSMIRNRETRVEENGKAKINYFRLALYGTGIGLVTGFLGAGGGFLIIPVLVLICRLTMKQAIGTSLLIISVNSLIGFTGDIGHANIDYRLLITVTLLAIVGIIIGTLLSLKINNAHLKKAFGWFVLAMGSYIIVKELFF